MMKIYKTLADLKPGTLFKAVHFSKNEIYVLTNRYIIDDEKPWRKIRICVSLRDGETSRFLETLPVILIDKEVLK